MKVVLRDYVESLGDRGEIVSVAAGYARNYLLPKGLALAATPGNMRVIEQQRRVWEVKESREIVDAKAIAERLAQVSLNVTKKAGDRGTLYGSVTNIEVAELLGQQGVEIDRRRIVLDQPIKSVGTHGISIKLHREVIAKISLEVTSENVIESIKEPVVESEFEGEE